MIWIVIAIHLLLSAGLLWVSWQVWLLRNALNNTVKTVDEWTEACQNGLQGSSPNIEIARDSVGSIRKQYQILQFQWEKIRKLLSVLARGLSFLDSRWQKNRKNTSIPLNNKSSNKSPRSKHHVKRRG